MLLSIIIPVYNEERLVGKLLEKVTALPESPVLSIEIIVVNDGSTDATDAAIRGFIRNFPDAPIHYFVHPRNMGKGAAVRTGFQHAKGGILIIQDADLEYDPRDIPEVVRPILEGSAEVVYGSRILMEKALGRSGVFGLITGKHPHSYVLAYLGGVAITKWTNLLAGSSLTDEPTCYKCFRRSALEGIRLEADDFSWEPEITVKLLAKGIKIHEVPISYHPRKNEEGKKINWKHGVGALWTVLKHVIRD